jgi:DNA-binding beta-propeller fold protein YncE
MARMLLAGLGAGLLVALWLARAAVGQPASLREVARILLPGVEGRMDHFAVDPSGNRLFVAALEHGTVEVVDLARNRRVAQVAGLHEPQGVLFAPAVQKLFVAQGGDAVVTVHEGRDLAATARIALRGDPDNLRPEPGAGRIWVGEGAGKRGALAAIGTQDASLQLEIGLDGHPEGFQLETSGPRIFVNVPTRREVEVVDRQRRRVVARWRLPHGENFPMAIDEGRRRLFVGCRRPARLLVLDTEKGGTVADLESPGDVDDIFLDPTRQRVYVSAGEGVVRVYERREGDRFESVGDVPTRCGARTSLLSEEAHRLYVAVPRLGRAPAEVRVFDTSGP